MERAPGTAVVPMAPPEDVPLSRELHNGASASDCWWRRVSHAPGRWITSSESPIMRHIVLVLASVAAAVATAGCRPSPSPAPARRPPGGVAEAAETPGDSASPASGGGRAAAPVRPQPYARVITSDYTTRAGLFMAHRRGDRLLYEIPRAQLGRDFLLVTQIARTTLGVGYGGQAVSNRVVRWEQIGRAHV